MTGPGMSEMLRNGTFIAWPEMTTALRVRAPASVKFASMLGFSISVQHLKFQEVDARIPWSAAEIEVDEGRVIGPVQSHIEREQDQERLAGGE